MILPPYIAEFSAALFVILFFISVIAVIVKPKVEPHEFLLWVCQSACVSLVAFSITIATYNLALFFV